MQSFGCSEFNIELAYPSCKSLRIRKSWATTALQARSGARSHPLAVYSLTIFQPSFPGQSFSCRRSETTYIKRNMLLEPMELRPDTHFWIHVSCKSTFGWLQMLGCSWFCCHFSRFAALNWGCGHSFFALSPLRRKWRIVSTRPHCMMPLKAGATLLKSERRPASQQEPT